MSFYDRRIWRDRIRPDQLLREPLCRQCLAQGRIVVATEVDHITPISAGGSEIADTNLQSLCLVCHSRKTRKDQGAQVSMGYSADGLPIDPEHPWNKPAQAG
jgi:5-methylcytosine-specific restriction endonuclease McrA